MIRYTTHVVYTRVHTPSTSLICPVLYRSNPHTDNPPTPHVPTIFSIRPILTPSCGDIVVDVTIVSLCLRIGGERSYVEGTSTSLVLSTGPTSRSRRGRERSRNRPYDYSHYSPFRKFTWVVRFFTFVPKSLKQG